MVNSPGAVFGGADGVRHRVGVGRDHQVHRGGPERYRQGEQVVEVDPPLSPFDPTQPEDREGVSDLLSAGQTSANVSPLYLRTREMLAASTRPARSTRSPAMTPLCIKVM